MRKLYLSQERTYTSKFMPVTVSTFTDSKYTPHSQPPFPCENPGMTYCPSTIATYVQLYNLYKQSGFGVQHSTEASIKP